MRGGMSDGTTRYSFADDDRAILALVYSVADFDLRADLGQSGVAVDGFELRTSGAIGLVDDDARHLTVILPTRDDAYRICSGRKMKIDILCRVAHLHS